MATVALVFSRRVTFRKSPREDFHAAIAARCAVTASFRLASARARRASSGLGVPLSATRAVAAGVAARPGKAMIVAVSDNGMRLSFNWSLVKVNEA